MIERQPRGKAAATLKAANTMVPDPSRVLLDLAVNEPRLRAVAGLRPAEITPSVA
jgi:hypothetical protein